MLFGLVRNCQVTFTFSLRPFCCICFQLLMWLIMQDMSMVYPAQELVAKDLHGEQWIFQHTYRGMFITKKPMLLKSLQRHKFYCFTSIVLTFRHYYELNVIRLYQVQKKYFYEVRRKIKLIKINDYIKECKICC